MVFGGSGKPTAVSKKWNGKTAKDENGNDITYSSIDETPKRYLELEEKGINVKNEQRKIYANAGLSEDMFDEGEDIMNWLLS